MCTQQISARFTTEDFSFSLLSSLVLAFLFFNNTEKRRACFLSISIILLFWWPVRLCGALALERGSCGKWLWATGSHHPAKDHWYPKFQTDPFGPCVQGLVAPQRTADVFRHKSLCCLTSKRETWPQPLCNARVNKQRQQSTIWSFTV